MARTIALSSLRELSERGSEQALFALGRALDRSVGPRLSSLAGSPAAKTRIAAVRALVDLGELATAAYVLADPDPHVRMTTSCALLLATRAPGPSI
jgi:hypothetical protein